MEDLNTAAISYLRQLVPVTLSLLSAGLIDLLSRRRGLEPPGFCAAPLAPPQHRLASSLRRSLAFVLLAFVLYVGVFASLGRLGLPREELALSTVSTPQLFLVHIILALCLLCWYALAFPPADPRPPGSGWRVQFGLVAARPWRELGLGALVGVGAWGSVLALLFVVSLFLQLVGQGELLPEEPPQLVVWLAGLPFLVRVGVSLSAGVVEEAFFRGFLQLRTGIAFSSALFVLAHLDYGQPLMLVGVAALSLVFSGLVWWRRSVLAAMAAHAVFDGIQLLILIPRAVELLEAQAPV